MFDDHVRSMTDGIPQGIIVTEFLPLLRLLHSRDLDLDNSLSPAGGERREGDISSEDRFHCRWIGNDLPFCLFFGDECVMGKRTVTTNGIALSSNSRSLQPMCVLEGEPKRRRQTTSCGGKEHQSSYSKILAS